MKICITRSERFSYSETFIADQISGLRRFAEIFSLHGGRLPERNDSDNLLSSYPYWIIHKIIKGATGNRNNYFGNYGVLKYLKENKIDVVISNYGISAAHILPICKHLNIPLIPIFHGHDVTDRKLIRAYSKSYKDLFVYSSALVVVSEEMRVRLLEFGAPSEKLHVIPCGVDTSKFVNIQNSPGKLFLAVGRFVEKKGPIYTIKAFSKVLEKFPDCKLVMIGAHNGLLFECYKLVKDLEIEKSVDFPGIISHSEITKYFNQAIAFVQHSVTASNGDMEGTPVSILEASACGLPIISTYHGGIKEAVIHGTTGYLVDEYDIEAMAKYMIDVLENPENAKTLGYNGRNYIVTHYNQSFQLQKLYKLAELSVAKSFSH